MSSGGRDSFRPTSRPWTSVPCSVESCRSRACVSCTATTAGFTSAKGQVTIQQTELNSLAHDAQLVTKQFSMSRVHEIFQRADRTAEGRAGDRALEVRTTTPSPM